MKTFRICFIVTMYYFLDLLKGKNKDSQQGNGVLSEETERAFTVLY